MPFLCFLKEGKLKITAPAIPLTFHRKLIKATIVNRLVGGTPTDPRLIEGWIKSRMPAASEAKKAGLAQATIEEVPKKADEAANWTTFRVDKATGQIFIGEYQMRAAIKEAANILRSKMQEIESSKKRKQEKDGGEKASSKSKYTSWKAKIAERISVTPDHIFLRGPDGKFLTKVDGSEERPIHVITPQGERSALKRSDFVEKGTTFEFIVQWHDDGTLDEDEFNTILWYISTYTNIGADRSQGNGRVEFEVFTIDSKYKLGDPLPMEKSA